MVRTHLEAQPEEKAEAALIQKQTYSDATLPTPAMGEVPQEYRDRLGDLFDTWHAVRGRNALLTAYYDMKNLLKDLGISIPANLLNVNCAVGWCAKAVDARAVRSVFDGFVFEGREDPGLSDLVGRNRLRSLYTQACKATLVHGLSAVTVMRGRAGQPSAKVRVHSANQFAALWDKDEGRIGCGVVLSDVDGAGRASRYVAHFPDAVLTLERQGGDRESWSCKAELNPMGRPLMEVLAHDPDIDRPLGHSLLTPELLGIVDKAMRDVLRMEVGAEFFTFPQRYALGVAEDLFSLPPEEGQETDEDGNAVDQDGNPLPPVPDEHAKFKAYVGALLAISRDENGDLPQVGQFAPSTADNFTRVFENDAQRFSGATNVPLAQLGVLSNTYTSSDALGAANDPLILAVENMNRQNGEVMEEVARMMMAVAQGTTLEGLSVEQRAVQACWKDPSMPTIAARADAWTKLGASDPSIVGTRVYYEGIGLSQATIDRLFGEKQNAGAISALNRIADRAEVPR